MYRPKMFKEAEKNTASPNIIVNIIVFIVVWALIMLAEGIIPGIMINPELTQRMKDEGLESLSQFQRMKEIATELTMQPKVFIVSLLCTGFGTLISMFHCRFVEARHLRSMGMRKEGALIHYLKGLLIGIGLMTAIVLITVITGINSISFCSGANLGMIALYLPGFLVQGMSEEFIFRGYFMTTIGSRHNTAIAVGLSAAAFSLAHFSNPGFNLLVFFNLALFGVFAALYMICFDNIWGVCAVHSIWNFTQGNFYGISVSGTGEAESVFRTVSKSSSAILTGGDFGIEGSMVTTIVLLAASAVVYMNIIKKSSETSE